MKNTNIYTKVLTFVLSFAIIIGTFGGMKLDARADEQEINEIEITVKEPVPGESFPGIADVNVITSEEEIKVTNVEWWKNSSTQVTQGGTVEYNTNYMVKVWLQAKENYVFANDIQKTVNGSSKVSSGFIEKYKVYFVTYNFPTTASDPAKTIDSVDIKVAQPVAGQALATTCDVSTQGVSANLVCWYYTDDRGEVNKPAEYNTVYKVQVLLSPKTSEDYEFASGITVTVNGKDSTELKEEESSFWVSYVFPATGSEPSGGETSGEIVPGNVDTTQPANDSESKPKHTCNFEWTIKIDPTTGADGLEEYKCTGCGIVKESHPIPASVAVIKDFYGNVKDAPENGSITYDSGKLYTISDYLLKKMSERNDVTVTVNFEYQNAKYELTFPAGTDYSAVLTDEETMYGYFGVAAKLGLKVVAK